ncbi:MAG: hypothetical protein ACRDNK_05170 [Solirubrobacteraceae bacterium]
MIQDRSPLETDPTAMLSQFRALGATTVRVIVNWYLLSPDPASGQMPAGFDPADPNAYAAAAWAPYDQTVRAAQADGMKVDFTLSGGAPAWAEGLGIPAQGFNPNYAWKPNATLYGAFAQAVGERYSGRFTAPGASAPLPAVHFWALWNEPNFGQDLAPQAINGSTLSVAPMMYRGLVDAGWRGLHQSGHGADTILIGELAARGLAGPVSGNHPQGLPGYYSQTKPMQFIRTLYCLDSRYRLLKGGAARAHGCPTTAAGSRAFRKQHPGLFSATGVADHPYPAGDPPVLRRRTDPDFATFPQLASLEHGLDRALGAYGSRHHYPIYNDEFGYITRPPQTAPYASPTTAAYYLNWTEYLSWKSTRVASYMQYLLNDPTPQGGHPGFASGLLTSSGQPKATFYAYRMPLYLPRTTLRRGRTAEVWGAVRPAPFMALDSGQSQSVAIQLQRGGHGPFSTLKSVPLSSPAGYFDLPVVFPASGRVRLAYTFPSGDSFLPVGEPGTTIYSRSVSITAR